MFKQAQRVGRELQGCKFVRSPVDTIPSEGTIVYEHMTDDLLSVTGRQALPLAQRKNILRYVIQGLAEMHSRDLVHTGILYYSLQVWLPLIILDLKPDNILLNYNDDRDSNFVVTAAKIADIDNAVHLSKGQAIYATVGNVYWRSPEAQLGVGISKPTDVFSFGLVVSSFSTCTRLYTHNVSSNSTRIQCIHVMLRINIFGFTQEELQPDIDTEPQVMDRMIRYFGLVPDALFKDITDQWRQILQVLNDSYCNEESFEPFSEWGQRVFPILATDPQFEYLDSGFKNFIGRMMSMDPKKRATVEELLDDPWW